MSDLQATLTLSMVDRFTARGKRIAETTERMNRAVNQLTAASPKITRAYQNQSRVIGRLTGQTRRLDQATARMQSRMRSGPTMRFGGGSRTRTAQPRVQAFDNQIAGLADFEQKVARPVARTSERLVRTNAKLEGTTNRVTKGYQHQNRIIERMTGSTRRLERANDRWQRNMMAGGGATLAGSQLMGMGRAMTQPFSQSLGRAGMFEDFEAEFEVLLGTSALAKQRIRDLSVFAAKTPFELPEINTASRTLQTLTGNVLSVGEGLRMVGDVSAGTGEPIERLAVWFGRLYDGIQAGRPVGEALMRLQEIGAVSGDTRNRLEQMTKAGEKGDKVWKVAAESFARYTGMMERKNQTLNGQISNASDAWTNFRAAVGRPLIPIVKPFISGMTWATEKLQNFTEKFPFLAQMAAIGVGSLGIVVFAAGSLVTVAGSLLGAIGMAAFGLEWLGIKSTGAAIRLRLLNRASLLSVAGLRKLGATAILTGKAGLVSVVSWIPKLMTIAATALPAVTASLGGVAAAVMAIPGIGWIAAGITLVAVLIWRYWKPIKAFLGGYWTGFREGMAPVFASLQQLWVGVKAGVGVLMMPWRMLLRILGKVFPSLDTSGKKFTNFGYVAGRAVGFLVSILMTPIKILGWIGRAVSWVASIFESGFSKAGIFIDWLTEKLQFLLGPARLVGNVLGGISNALGFGDDEDAPVKPRRAPIVRTAMATGALSLSPAYAQPQGISTMPMHATPIHAAPFPVAPINHQAAAPIELNINAPITISSQPGMDEAALGRMVSEHVAAAIKHATQQALDQYRRRNRD